MTSHRRPWPAAVAVLAVLCSALLTATPSPAATTGPILFGLHDHTDQDRVATEHAVGKRSALVGNFVGWDNGLPSQRYFDNWVISKGAVAVIATGPGGYAPLSRVVSGAEDATIVRWADATRAYGHPIMFRLMAEMNGGWEPWSTNRNGNKPGEYVQAWRHVVDLFRARGATNARWVWNPDRSFPGATPMRSLWPGAAYVDWIGLDVYNFNKGSTGGWLSFSSMMKPSEKEIRAAAGWRKPLMINEVGCAQAGQKPAWIKAMYASLPRYGVKAVLWFDEQMVADWRLAATAANRAAARYALAHGTIKGAGQLTRARIERIVTTGR